MPKHQDDAHQAMLDAGIPVLRLRIENGRLGYDLDNPTPEQVELAEEIAARHDAMRPRPRHTGTRRRIVLTAGSLGLTPEQLAMSSWIVAREDGRRPPSWALAILRETAAAAESALSSPVRTP